MHDTLRIYLFAFGAFTVVGGLIGYAKAKSSASLIAGAVFGGLLVVAGYLTGRGGWAGPGLGLFLSAMLTGRFSKAFRQSRKVMPAGIMTILGVVGMGLSLLGLGR